METKLICLADDAGGIDDVIPDNPSEAKLSPFRRIRSSRLCSYSDRPPLLVMLLL